LFLGELGVNAGCRTPDVPGEIHLVVCVAKPDLQFFLVQLTLPRAAFELLKFFDGLGQIASHNLEI
jgi:hypothetical protein